MKLVGVEEHLITPAVRDAWYSTPTPDDDVNEGMRRDDIERKLLDLDGERLKMMDDCGVDVQVLSVTSPGLNNLTASDSVALARDTNDLIAAAIARHPGRFEGFATLALSDPQAAASELERAVNELGLKGSMLYGRVRDKNIDHPDFLPVFEAAAHLRVPLFIHPQVAPRPVRQAYYSGLDNKPLESAFAMFGLGWHYETGVQFVRLVLSGVFDKYPDLQIILGHWGELVLFYLDRIDNMSRMANLERRVADYFKNNLYVTCSGMFYREFLPRTIDIVGIDRMLFSTDFPYQFAPDLGARKFVEDSELSAADKVKFAHANWERLTNSKEARS